MVVCMVRRLQWSGIERAYSTIDRIDDLTCIFFHGPSPDFAFGRHQSWDIDYHVNFLAMGDRYPTYYSYSNRVGHIAGVMDKYIMAVRLQLSYIKKG